MASTLTSVIMLIGVQTLPTDNCAAIHFMMEMGRAGHWHLYTFAVGLVATVIAGSMYFEAATHNNHMVYPCAVPCVGIFIACVVPTALKMSKSLNLVTKAHSKLLKDKPTTTLSCSTSPIPVGDVYC